MSAPAVLADRRAFRVVGAVLAAVLAAGVAAALLAGPGTKTATVYFSQVVNLYPGDDVRVMGVPVGQVDAVTPEAGQVRVDLHYDADAPVPADAGAAIIAPTLVSGRIVQLAPARAEGARLPDGAVIDVEHTVVPVEWGQITTQIDQLTAALGPQGANSGGAVSRLLGTTAANLDGQGGNLRATIDGLSKAVGTLSSGSDDLFATVRNLQTLVGALAAADQQVGQFNSRLADVSSVLAGSSGDLGRLLDTLDSSVQRIGAFVEQHRDQLSGNLVALEQVSKNLAGNRQALADLLQKAPPALSNFQNIYEPFTGSISGAFALTNLRDPGEFICASIYSAGGTPEQCKQAIGPLAELVRMDVVPVRANPIQRNGGANQVDARDGAAPDPHPTVPPPAHDDRPTPPTLAGLLAPGAGQ